MSDATPSLALFTDLYQLTMAQAYWQSSTTAPAAFSLFFRGYPPNRGYMVFAGLLDVLDYLERFRFTPADMEYLRSTNKFEGRFLDWLEGLRFTGSVRAMAEGTLFFPNEPVIEVTAPVIEAQLVETYLLNQVNVQSLLATKAARVVYAARGRSLVDFAARRTQGTDAALKLARVSYMTGFSGTSNVMAGALYGIPTFGTMAHSFVTCFASEADSFRAYAASFPDTSTFLVDTYDTIQGVRNTVQVAREMKEKGHILQAVRLDSGDMLRLSHEARKLLDEAELQDVDIFASGGLDEYQVEELLEAGAPIDAFGVGTKVGVSGDAPWTDCAYKLVEYDGQPVLKLSTGKQTLPGRKQVYRYSGPDGMYTHDVIACADEGPSEDGAKPLLQEVMRDGKRLERPSALRDLRERFAQEFARLSASHKALRNPARYRVETSPALERLRRQVTQQIVQKELGE